MLAIIATVVNMTLGLIVNKARDKTAEKLQGKDLTVEECRQLIVRELDDIKTKLDGLARSALLASMNFFREGLVTLGDLPDDRTGQSQAGAIDQACALVKHGFNPDMTSNASYQRAIKCFEEANKKATEAFSNEALTIDDRIMATKLRIASIMLLSIENPDLGIKTSMLYLADLHSLATIKQIFTVHLRGGLRSRLNATKRREYVDIVVYMNFMVYDFRMKFGNETMVNLLGWPIIKAGRAKSYNPLFDSEDLKQRLPVQHQPDIYSYPSVVNSAGKIIAVKSMCSDEIVINTSCSEQRKFCSVPNKDAPGFGITSLAIDQEDNVFIPTITESTSSSHTYSLFCVDENGNIKKEWSLKFFSGKKYPKIAVSEDKKIVITSERKVYVCEDINEEQLKVTCEFKSDCDVCNVCISNQNEIVVSSFWPPVEVHLYTMKGKFVRKFKLNDEHRVKSLAFNYVTHEILVYIWFENKYYLSRYSTSGEIIQTIDITSFSSYVGTIRSHPSGPVILVDDTKILRLQ